MAIYRNRWQYHPPRDSLRRWRPAAEWSGDEFCNPSIRIVVPGLGNVVIFYRRGKMTGVMDDDYPCFRCKTQMLKADLNLDPRMAISAMWCKECDVDWWLPRDKDSKLCEHLRMSTGTDDPKLAYHVRTDHVERRCRCIREHWFSENDVLMAVAAWNEQKNQHHRD